MLTLTFEQFQELLLQSGKQKEKENLPEGIYHSSYNSTIDTPFCKGYAHNVTIRDGITLIKLQLTFLEETTIEIKNDLALIGFWYCLKGNIKGYRQNTVSRKDSELSYLLSSNNGYFYATAASQGWMQLQKGMIYKAAYILFSYPSFKHMIGEQIAAMPKEFLDALEDENGFYMKPITFTSHIRVLCESIFENPFRGKSRQFYREAKVIELLAYQLDNLTNPAAEMHSTGIKLSPKEEKQIEYSRHLLLSSLQNPPSMIELSMKIGMSSFRLKNGFRQMYGTTPYRFIVDQRMIKAKELLQKRELSVSEVALAVGFSSLGTFSNTFYEKYGIRPSDLLEKQ
jgi:AraC-like DNA-binding protein